MRALALTYVHGLRPTPDCSRVSFNLIRGVGEYFVFPALTHSGPCASPRRPLMAGRWG